MLIFMGISCFCNSETVECQSYCSGADEQAFGALIRMAFATVGAILSIVAGVVMRDAFMPAP